MKHQNRMPVKKWLSVCMALVILLTSGLFTLPGGAATKIQTLSTANKHLKQGAVRGIDVSMWQGNINWKKVAKDDVSFAFVRASVGKNIDEYFVYNATNAHANGIRVGAYHYAHFRSTKSMQQEARHFVRQLKKVNITYPVVLDVENHYGLSKAQLTKLVLEFIRIVEAEGYTVMLYSYQNFIAQHLDYKKLKNTDLWVANYLSTPKGIHHSVWQHTSRGRVAGIQGNVDINISYRHGKKNNNNNTKPKVITLEAHPDADPSPVPSKPAGSNTTTAKKTTVVKAEQTSVSNADSATYIAKQNPKERPSQDGEQDTAVVPTTTMAVTAKPNAQKIPLTQPTQKKKYQVAENLDNRKSGNIVYHMQTNYPDIIPAGGVSVSVLIPGIAAAIQAETGFGTTGTLTDEHIDTVARLDFADEANQNITKLLQAKLFYLGYYTAALTGEMDEHTVESIIRFQQSRLIENSGTFDFETVMLMFEDF